MSKRGGATGKEGRCRKGPERLLSGASSPGYYCELETWAEPGKEEGIFPNDYLVALVDVRPETAHGHT